jgi:hypothetical protein
MKSVISSISGKLRGENPQLSVKMIYSPITSIGAGPGIFIDGKCVLFCRPELYVIRSNLYSLKGDKMHVLQHI